MILHTVAFTLHHPPGSDQEKDFFSAATRLQHIPAVQSFSCYKQIFADSKFDFCISVQFKSQADYDTYNTHPAHLVFVEAKWNKDVEQFLILDYEQYSNF